jgi:DNA repair protein RadD
VPASPPTLRRYQQGIIAAVRRSYTDGKRAPLAALATAAGKTVIFAAMIADERRAGRSSLVAVHRRELVIQASEKLYWAGVPHGIIAAGLDIRPNEPVQVGSVQTLARRLHNIGQFDLLVIDEAHHARAEQWYALIQSQRDALLLGVTATPARLDGKGLGINAGGPFDDLILGPSTRELIDAGYLSPCRCFVPERRPDLHNVRVQAGDYVVSDLAEAVDRPTITGDAVRDYRLRADGEPAIAFCATVAHAEHVATSFRAAGYRAQCVHGGTPKDERDAAIAGLGTGAVEVLTSCDLISEGLDVPAVGAVILLRPTKSLVLHRQQIGRGMRVADGKDRLIVNDHVGNVLVHGLPDVEPAWTLDGVTKRPGEAPVWTCPECGAVNPLSVRVCEECGYELPPPRRSPEATDGRLVELTADRQYELLRMRYREILNTRLSREELQLIADAHGYKPGWVWHRLREQQGIRP